MWRFGPLDFYNEVLYSLFRKTGVSGWWWEPGMDQLDFFYFGPSIISCFCTLGVAAHCLYQGISCNILPQLQLLSHTDWHTNELKWQKKNNNSNLAVDWSAVLSGDTDARSEFIYSTVLWFNVHPKIARCRLFVIFENFTMNLTAEGSWGMIRIYFTGRECVWRIWHLTPVCFAVLRMVNSYGQVCTVACVMKAGVGLRWLTQTFSSFALQI